MGLILDIILCLIALSIVISGFKAGLVRTLVELIGFVLSIVASFVFADYFTDIISSILIKIKPVTALGGISIKIISMLIIFALLQMLVQVVSRALNAVFKLPGLNIINSLLGGILGLIKGVLAVFLICAVLQITIPFISIKNPKIKEAEISNSVIYQFVYEHNPIYSLFQGKFKMRYM